MIFLLAVAALAGPPAQPALTHPKADTSIARCPRTSTALCRAIEASKAGTLRRWGAAIRAGRGRACRNGDPARRDQALAAAGNMWIAAGQPGKAALALDRALAGTGLKAEQHGLALLDRARAAEAQGDLKTARAKVNEAAKTISEDPYLWYLLRRAGASRGRYCQPPNRRSTARSPWYRIRRRCCSRRAISPRRRARMPRPATIGRRPLPGDPNGPDRQGGARGAEP